jgi:hypothetical protein
MIAFAGIAHHIVGKPVETVIRSAANRSTIPPDIAAIVSSKYTFSVAMAEESFRKEKKSYQLNGIITAYGKQRALPLHGPNQTQLQMQSVKCHAQSSSSVSQYNETPTNTLALEHMALQTPVKNIETSNHHEQSGPNL